MKKPGPKQLNGRQEAFVRAFVAQGCQNALKATRAAGYADSSSPRRSNLLMKHPLILAKIASLKKAVSTAIFSAQETLAAITSEATNMESHASSRIRALELLAKYHGLLIERQEIGKPGEFDKLTDEQVEAEIKLMLERRPASEMVM